MKRIVSLLVFGLAFSTVLLAQPSINVVVPEGDPPCTGETICLDVEVADFTNILSTEYYIEWDSTTLQFTGTGAYNLPGLSAANFTTINAGRVLLTWEFDDCTDPGSTAYTITDDGTAIFEICFTALGVYGASSQVIIPTTGAPDLSTPFIRRKFGTNTTASCQNIGIATANVDTAFVGTCLRPFIIDISDEGGNEGDLVCIDFSVLGFDELTSFQFPVVWDSTKAVYEDLIVPQNLPNFNEACCFGVPGMAAGVQQGSITVSWSAPPPSNVTTIDDSTLIFQLCLRLKEGTCASDFDVNIADQQPGQPFFKPQASNEFGGGFANIPIGQFAGNVQIGECDPTGIELVANCGAPISLNDTICVAIEAGTNFTDVTELEFLMEWNSSVLQYIGVQNVNLLNLAYPADFIETNTSNGILGLMWENNFAVNSAEGTILYEVCFEAVGLGGNSPITFINNDDDVAAVNFGPNIGINPTNCEVTINQPAGVVIEITDDLEGRPGDTLCFDFPVTNFTDIESMSFSLVFEPNNMEFILAGGIQNINLPGASAFNFGLLGAGGGQITFDWTAGSPVTLADGTSLFTLCYRIPDDASPGTCDQLLLTDTPLEAEVITSTSNGENVGLTGIGGNYCILSPEGFYLEGAAVTGDLRDTICVSYKVSEFDDITDASFCLNWNPGTLGLIDIVDQGLIPGLNISIAGSPVGSACFDFTAPGGLSLPDSANIFDLCFELLGPADTCYTVEVNDSPSSTVNTLNGPGSLLDIDGEICVNDKLFITTLDDLIVPESCAGAEDGCIQVLVSGGVGPYIYSWNSSPFQNTPKARFLPGGEIILTVIDQTGLLVRDTFIIPTLGGNLFANAGADRLSSCNEDFPCTLVNPSVASGDDIVYSWTATQGGAVCSSPNNPILLGRGPGLFILEVQDTTTGCFVTDSIRLLEPFLPPTGIDADAPAITCVDDMVQLTVQNDSDTLQYSWTAPDGTLLVDADPDGTTVMASDSGYYVLTTEVITTGCISVDSILVDIDTIPPIAIAAPGMDTTFIGCEDMALLEGFAGDNTTNLTVQWFDEGGMPAAAANDFDFETNVPGIYTFEVTNTITGCTNSGTTVVSQNANVPNVTILMDPVPAFNCTGDPVALSVEVTNVNNPNLLTIAWIGDVNPATAADFNTTALSAGMYEVIVENTANNCISSAEITIGFDTVAPVVTIDPVDQLNCNNDDVMITSSVTPADGEYLYEWFSIGLNDAITPDPTDPSKITIGYVAAGTSTLTVTDTLTGCVSEVQQFVVEVDTAGTVFDVGFIPSLNCEVDTVSVLTSVELPAGTFTVDWLPQNGMSIPTIVDSVAVFTSANLSSTGEYLVAVTNEINGCTTVDTVLSTVNVFLDQPTAVLASDNEMINCLISSVILDASGSTVGDTLTPISYQWNIISGDAEGSLTNDSLLIEQGGEYQFVVTNEASLCTDTVTATVMEDFEEPLAVAENEAISLICSNNQGVLSALGSSEGPEFTYTWLELDPDSLDVLGVFGEGFTLPVATPGLYQLVITNNDNGCVSMDNPTVLVDGDGELPQIVFGTPTEPALGLYDLDCASPDTLLVTYFVSNDTFFDLDDLVFDWTNADIEVIQTGQLFSALIPLDGITGTEIFNLMVVDQATGCEGENEFVIENIVEFPSAEIVPDTDLTIGCDENPVQIDGSASSQGDEFSYAWQNIDGEELATGITFDANTAGTYELVVTNNDNFCQDSIEIIVMLDTIGPVLVLDSIPGFDCDDTVQLISAENTGDAADFTATWINTNGASIVGLDGTLTANVTGPGVYTLQLVSNENLCDTMVTFTVEADTLAPTIMIDTMNLAMLACEGSAVDIMTTINSGTQSITWDGPGNVNPPNALNVNVDAAGTYTVTVVADNGCTNTASVEVMEDPDGGPVAILEASDFLLGCADTITLSYTGTSLGEEFTYQYITVEGTGVAIPANDSLSAQVFMGGDYSLVVTNELNGCSDTSEVLMIEMIELETTSAQIDSAGCGDVAIVSASLPNGATGVWTGPIGVTIVDPTSSSTLVSGLGTGENNLVFTISYDGCPDYAADTVAVLPELAPIALDDELILDPGQTANSLNVVDNDELGGITEFTVTFDIPILGDVVVDSTGNVNYTLLTTLLQPASDEFTYEICSKNCPELCAQATVTVTINRDSVEITVPNGFTPNNDGMNDELVFDQLLTNPEDFKDNELIVFNRWGDIVFEAQPYNNDWRGTNQEGNDLPDGTYYFILRLNIGDGEIIRGDVTIIR